MPVTTPLNSRTRAANGSTRLISAKSTVPFSTRTRSTDTGKGLLLPEAALDGACCFLNAVARLTLRSLNTVILAPGCARRTSFTLNRSGASPKRIPFAESDFQDRKRSPLCASSISNPAMPSAPSARSVGPDCFAWYFSVADAERSPDLSLSVA